MKDITIKELLESGVHFGHQTHRWNPKMKTYIFGHRNGIHIIDLQQTVKKVNDLNVPVRELAEKGKVILFVGTKKQAKESIQEAAEKAGMPYVNERWLGGMLTNFETIRQSISKLEELEKMEEEGTHLYLKKKEVAVLRKKRNKLEKVLGGIRKMNKAPDFLLVIDPKKEDIAVKEANKLGIPVMALVDTNTDPDPITYPIPGNDDAIRAIKLITHHYADIIAEGRQTYLRVQAEEAEKARILAEKKAKEDAERRAKEEAERKVREEAEKKAKVEADKNAAEAAKKKAAEAAEIAKKKAAEAAEAAKKKAAEAPASVAENKVETSEEEVAAAAAATSNENKDSETEKSE